MWVYIACGYTLYAGIHCMWVCIVSGYTLYAGMHCMWVHKCVMLQDADKYLQNHRCKLMRV